jgi:hypothetical protein
VFCLRAGELLAVEPALLLCLRTLDATGDKNDPVHGEARNLLCRFLETGTVSTDPSIKAETVTCPTG